MNRLSSTLRAAVALLGLSASETILAPRRADACQMPPRKKLAAATSTPEGSDTPKTLVLIDKHMVLAEETRAELERIQAEDEFGVICLDEIGVPIFLDPFVEAVRLMRNLALAAPRSPFADRGSYSRAPRWLRQHKTRQSHARRSARNQTRPQGHVSRSLRALAGNS